MDALLSDVGQFIQANQTWAAPIIGLVAFGESLVLVGLFIPATAVMMVIGGLLGAGVIEPIPVVACAILGATLGDIVSYAIGRWMGPGVVHKWPLNRYRPAVARTRLFFRTYGFASVFIGRFLGPIRSTVPLVAGMMAMSQTRFQIANVLSAALWAPLMFAPGYIAARSAAAGPGASASFSTPELLAMVASILVLTVIATVIGGSMIGSRKRRDRKRGIRAADAA